MLKTAVKRTPRFNYSDYLLLPEDTRYEILDGDLRIVPIPAVRHQVVALRIAAALLRHVEPRRLGRVLQAPCDVVFSEETVTQPDILFISRKRRGMIGETSLRGAPDIVVEVVSEATRERDLREKRKIYERFEVPEYWIADPDARTIETLVWSEMGYVSVERGPQPDRLYSPLLPNFSLPLSKVFAAEDQ